MTSSLVLCFFFSLVFLHHLTGILTSSGYPASSALQRWAAPWTSASDHTSSSPPYCASHRPNLTAEQIPFKNTAWDEGAIHHFVL